jgi:hypothetical protein
MYYLFHISNYNICIAKKEVINEDEEMAAEEEEEKDQI